MFRSEQEKAAWDIAAKHEEFHWEDLAAGGVPLSSAQVYLLRWAKAGTIEIARLDGNRKWFRMAGTRAKRADAPKPKTREDAMWAVMRRQAYFTPLDLVAIGDQLGIEITETHARQYSRALMTAGYLRCLEQAVPGKKQPKYRLINNTGRRAPVKRRITGLLDQNDGAFVPLGDGS
ncbi:hypothetical protein [uncultured Tateyamaria sp.]|uniref:hypothetical protein n=1 Tax=uncultured Tateyamaria sp. TaxID=455651 RepID=UPI002620D8FE|nr:hypothetical protein [uncultured Tateyamaria sp.]